MGLDMMLKALGIDPEEIKRVAGQHIQYLVDIKSQLDRIEAALELANAQIDAQSGKGIQHGQSEENEDTDDRRETDDRADTRSS